MCQEYFFVCIIVLHRTLIGIFSQNNIEEEGSNDNLFLISAKFLKQKGPQALQWNTIFFLFNVS